MRTRSTTATVLAAAALSALGAGTALAAATVTGSALTIKTQHSSVAPKAKDTITGTLTSHGKILIEQNVYLESRTLGAKTFTQSKTRMVTDSKGRVVFTVVPGSKAGHKEQYELRFPGNKTHRGSHSGIVTVTVT